MGTQQGALSETTGLKPNVWWPAVQWCTGWSAEPATFQLLCTCHVSPVMQLGAAEDRPPAWLPATVLGSWPLALGYIRPGCYDH